MLRKTNHRDAENAEGAQRETPVFVQRQLNVNKSLYGSDQYFITFRVRVPSKLGVWLNDF
jgi:hypothetical protein